MPSQSQPLFSTAILHILTSHPFPKWSCSNDSANMLSASAFSTEACLASLVNTMGVFLSFLCVVYLYFLPYIQVPFKWHSLGASPQPTTLNSIAHCWPSKRIETVTGCMAGWSCTNSSKDQAQRVQHTLSFSTISALLLLPSSHQLTQERQPPHSRQYSNMGALQRWGTWTDDVHKGGL